MKTALLFLTLTSLTASASFAKELRCVAPVVTGVSSFKAIIVDEKSVVDGKEVVEQKVASVEYGETKLVGKRIEESKVVQDAKLITIEYKEKCLTEAAFCVKGDVSAKLEAVQGSLKGEGQLRIIFRDTLVKLREGKVSVPVSCELVN